jgi:SAM-dependent methyltransferase
MIEQLRGLARDHLPEPVVDQLRRARRRLLTADGDGQADQLPGTGHLSDAAFVDQAYWFLLERPPDPVGRPDKLAKLRNGMTRRELLRELAESPEFTSRAPVRALESLHRSRMLWIQSLPPARQILDLGGVSLSSDDGALVQLGYPYPFEQLTIVDLPPEDRHELYHGGRVDRVVQTSLGPVSYRYHSMADLDGIADGSIDLVYSGQTFEHVTPADGERVLAEVARVLRPGGALALDTPNRAATAIQLRDVPGEFIDPDHEIEYTHAQMLDLFGRFGFTVERQHGLNLVRTSVEQDRFVEAELAAHPGLYDDIESCYLLAYVVRRDPVS